MSRHPLYFTIACDVVGGDALAAEDHKAFDHVAQLAYVAVEGVRSERLERVRRGGRAAAPRRRAQARAPMGEYGRRGAPARAPPSPPPAPPTAGASLLSSSR